MIHSLSTGTNVFSYFTMLLLLLLIVYCRSKVSAAAGALQDRNVLLIIGKWTILFFSFFSFVAVNSFVILRTILENTPKGKRSILFKLWSSYITLLFPSSSLVVFLFVRLGADDVSTLEGKVNLIQSSFLFLLSLSTLPSASSTIRLELSVTLKNMPHRHFYLSHLDVKYSWQEK